MKKGRQEARGGEHSRYGVSLTRTPATVLAIVRLISSAATSRTPVANHPLTIMPLYPALEEIKESLLPEQLAILKRQLDSEQPNVSIQTRFNYGWGLVKSADRKLQQHGLEQLAQVYREDTSMHRETLYYMAVGSYKVGEYSNARRYCDALLKIQPDNSQAHALKEMIEDKVTQDGMIGLGVAGGVIAVGVGLLTMMARKKRK